MTNPSDHTTGEDRSVSGEREIIAAAIFGNPKPRDGSALPFAEQPATIRKNFLDSADRVMNALRTAAPTPPSTAAGEMAFVCGCGWDGSYADLNETVEGMTCPKCRLGRNLDCAAALATPPAQAMKQPGPKLVRAMKEARLRSAKIIEDVPWQEQAAQHLIQRADRINQENGFYTLVGEALYQAADELRALIPNGRKNNNV